MEPKTKQVITVDDDNGNWFKVIRRTDDNTYRVYRMYYARRQSGCGLSKRSKQVAKCENLRDSICVIYQLIRG